MIEHTLFGRTGHESSRVLFGAAALGGMKQDRADRLLEPLFEHGVNHLDTAASYGDSELRLAPWLRRYRSEFFVASKTGARDYAGARDSIQRSLERLQIERLDLIQLHNLVEPAEHEQALGPGGALEAAVEARDAGLVRFIGVTGHGTRVCAMHCKSLERFAFDSVLAPYNWTMMQSPEYAADFEALVSLCAERSVALQTIKSVARRRWRDDDPSPRFSWYEPLRDPTAIQNAVHFVLRRPGLFLNTSSDATLLPQILAAAEKLEMPEDGTLDGDTRTHGIEPLFVRGASEGI